MTVCIIHRIRNNIFHYLLGILTIPKGANIIYGDERKG